jgi:hypothetical protein
MNRRRLLLGTGALALLWLAGCLLVLSLLPRPDSTKEKCERIKPGMTWETALEILGPVACPGFGIGSLSYETRDFDLPDSQVTIAKDMSGQVLGCEFRPKSPPSIWHRLRRLLPW